DVEVRLSLDRKFDANDELLTAFRVGPLGPGQSTTGTLQVGLPISGATVSSAPTRVYVGLRLDAGNKVAESDETNNSGLTEGNDNAPLTLVQTVAGAGSNNTITAAQPQALNTRVTGQFSGAGDQDFFQLSPQASGRLTIRAVGQSGVDPVVVLL